MEFILAYACLNGHGCSETLQTYSYYNPAVVVSVEDRVKEIRVIVPVILSDYILPLTAASAGATATFKLNNTLTLGVNRVNFSINYNLGF